MGRKQTLALSYSFSRRALDAHAAAAEAEERAELTAYAEAQRDGFFAS